MNKVKNLAKRCFGAAKNWFKHHQETIVMIAEVALFFIVVTGLLFLLAFIVAGAISFFSNEEDSEVSKTTSSINEEEFYYKDSFAFWIDEVNGEPGQWDVTLSSVAPFKVRNVVTGEMTEPASSELSLAVQKDLHGDSEYQYVVEIKITDGKYLITENKEKVWMKGSGPRAEFKAWIGESDRKAKEDREFLAYLVLMFEVIGWMLVILTIKSI